MTPSLTCCSRPSSLAAWLSRPGVRLIVQRRLIRPWWLVSALVMCGCLTACTCGPTAKLTTIPEGFSEIPDIQFGIHCQEKVK